MKFVRYDGGCVFELVESGVWCRVCYNYFCDVFYCVYWYCSGSGWVWFLVVKVVMVGGGSGCWSGFWFVGDCGEFCFGYYFVV